MGGGCFFPHVFFGHKASAILVQTHMTLKMLGEFAGEHLKNENRAHIARMVCFLGVRTQFWP